MNRENKRKIFEKGYYKTHPCRDSFTCKVCGWLVTPEAAGSDYRNHCPNCLSSLHMDEEPGPGRRVWWRDGPHRGLGPEKRRVGGHPPVPPVR